MSLESIEKELKSIKLILILFLLTAMFNWAQGDEDEGLQLMLSGAIMLAGASALQSGRINWPRTAKLASYSGAAIVFLGLALMLFSAVVPLISIFV